MNDDATQSESPGLVRTTPIQNSLEVFLTAGAVIFWAFVLWWAWTQSLSRPEYTILFLGGILSLYLIHEAKQSIAEHDYADLLILVACGLVIVITTAYIYPNFDAMYVERQGFALDREYQLAWLIIAVITYLTWREYGNLFLALVLGTMLYALYGYYVPGLFSHTGIGQKYMLEVLVTDIQGFYGSLTQLTAAWIAPFILYAGLLFGFGAFDYVLRLAIYSARHIRSGVAQTAVVTSAIIGSINGSKAANAGMTGSFTIPTMMNSGLSSRTAAATEGAASTLGQTLPPVMGAAAFVMASTLGVSYSDILVAGVLPAAIMIICILTAVHLISIKEVSSQNISHSDHFDAALDRSEKIFEAVRFGVPFFVLILTLGYFQYTVMTSALYTVITMITLGISMPVVRDTYQALRAPNDIGSVGGIWTREWWTRGSFRTSVYAQKDSISWIHNAASSLRSYREHRFLHIEKAIRSGTYKGIKETIQGSREGVVILAPIVIILTAVGGIVDLLMTTGIPSRISIMLMDLSGGILVIAVVFGMLTSILMGIGMPTVAAYVIVSTLVAPTFINEFAIPEFASHYMVFYASVLAGVTPPIAVSVAVASGIAGANFWKASISAILISAPLFVLPITFVYHPSLVSASIAVSDILAAVLITIGGIMIAYGLNYQLSMRRLYRYPIRTGLVVVGVVIMAYPSYLVKVAGVGLFILFYIIKKHLNDQSAQPSQNKIYKS